MASGRFRPGLTPPTVVGVILAVAAVRLVFAALIPLTEDEAYYRLWSLRLQLGYFDHPPMIAWWIAAGRALVGDTALGARLLSVLANAAAAFLLMDALRTLGVGERPALRAGLWLNATLLIGVGGLLAIPDAPTLLFWTATLWALARATRARAACAVLGWWTLAGLAAGLAVLSKYSALFLAAGVLLWLCSTAENRRRLSAAGPWVAAAAALIVIVPHIAWNAANGWVSVIKQFGRVGAQSFEPVHFAALIGGQFVLLNPIIAVFAVRAVVRAGTLKSPEALLWLSSTPFILYLAVHSLHDPVQAHWPAPVYPALVGLAAIAAERVRQNRPGGLFWRRATPFVGIGLVSVSLTLAAVPGLDAIAGPATRPLRGWAQFGAAVQARAATPDKDPAAWVGTMSYGLAAQLAAEPGLTLPIVQLNDRARYDPLPPVAIADFERPGLVIDLPRRVTAEALRTCFATVEVLEPIRRDVGTGTAGAHVAYAAFRVSRPIRIVSGGCWRGRDMPLEPSSRESRPGAGASPPGMGDGRSRAGRVADPAREPAGAALHALSARSRPTSRERAPRVTSPNRARRRCPASAMASSRARLTARSTRQRGSSPARPMANTFGLPSATWMSRSVSSSSGRARAQPPPWPFTEVRYPALRRPAIVRRTTTGLAPSILPIVPEVMGRPI